MLSPATCRVLTFALLGLPQGDKLGIEHPRRISGHKDRQSKRAGAPSGKTGAPGLEKSIRPTNGPDRQDSPRTGQGRGTLTIGPALGIPKGIDQGRKIKETLPGGSRANSGTAAEFNRTSGRLPNSLQRCPVSHKSPSSGGRGGAAQAETRKKTPMMDAETSARAEAQALLVSRHMPALPVFFSHTRGGTKAQGAKTFQKS